MKLKFIFVIILTLLIVDLSYAQEADFNFIGAGARARGMGGAFIGLADDATAMSWNPAGLAKLETPEASVVGMITNYGVSSDIDEFDEEPYKSSHANLNFISGAVPLNIGARNLVAGVAYQQIMDLYYKYDGEDYTDERTGGIYAITPAIGVQLSPTFSLGASFNIYTGKTEYTSEDLTGEWDDESYEYSYSATNFNVGALFDYDKFRLGAVFKTGFDLKEEYEGRDFSAEISMPNILGFGVSYLATENLTLAADYEMRSFSESEITYEDSEPDTLGWEDINQLRVGAEYLMMSGDNIIPLRLGFATTPSLYKDDQGDQITGYNLTAGVGIIMGNINLDLGIEYNQYSYEFEGWDETYEYSENYLRFIIAGVFHFNK
ncbi:hypothetical protein JXB12_00255 [candidate division KSB1 bacterium]|nr:hypothetical protein [candidate division KSB1 bacterium]